MIPRVPRRFFLLPIILPAALALGCAGTSPAPADLSPAPAVDVPAASVADTVAAEPETTAALPPGGRQLENLLRDRPDLAQLEGLYRQALDLLAGSRPLPARDVLFVLKGEAVATVPADDDSLARDYLRSLERRVSLLAGVVAEEQLMSRSVAPDDSLVAAVYDEMRGLSMPDSLIPVTGPERRAIDTDLVSLDHELVDKWLGYFTGPGRQQMQAWLDRKAAVDSLVDSVLDEAGLPRELIWLCAIESGFNPRARSGVGAVGPWQFMAGTARHYGLRCDWWVDERQDMEMSTRAAATYLTQLYHMFGDWALVIAAYNTGEHRIERAIQTAGQDDVRGLPMPWQTRNHVMKFAAAARIGDDPGKYGFTPPPDDPQLQYDVVQVTDATDVGLIAECAGVGRDAVASLNPALLRGATPPGRSDYPVRVPPGVGGLCARKLRGIPADKRLTWRRHTVERGETLSQIAAHYGTSVGDIARLNKIRNVSRIHPGDRLLIPMPAVLAARAEKRTRTRGHYVPPEGYVRVSYHVHSGDTLSSIARKLGVSLKHLYRVNGLRSSSVIHPGQRIYAYRPPRS